MSESNEVSYFSRQDSPLEKRIAVMHSILLYIGMAFILAMMLLTVAHSLGRYVFNQPIPGVCDLSSYFLVIAVFLTGSYTAVIKGHIALGVIVDRLSERTRAIINSATYLLSVAICLVAAVRTFMEGNKMMQVGQVSQILQIPNAPFYYVVAFGWAAIGSVMLMHLIHSLRSGMNK